MALALVLAVGIVAAIVVATRDRGPAAGSVEGFQAALHPIDVSAAEADLASASARGAREGRLLALTNQLLDLIRDDSASERRAAIDAGLAAVTGAGCPICEDALERARP